MDNPFLIVLILKFTVTLFTHLHVLLCLEVRSLLHLSLLLRVLENGKDEERLIPLVQITYPGIHKPVRMTVNMKTMLSNMQSYACHPNFKDFRKQLLFLLLFILQWTFLLHYTGLC